MTTILISVKSNCENYYSTVKHAQNEIVSYFGNKHAIADDEMPLVKIDNIEVDNADVNTLKNAISAFCKLLVIVNSDSPQINDGFIFLNKE